MADERHALLITSSVYDDAGLQGLVTPGNDARDLGKVLKHSDIGAFNVSRVTNPVSSRAAEKVEQFFASRDYDDVLLLYFSGHGIKADDGELYFATRNTRRSALRSTSVPASFIRDVMHESQSQRQILLLDCCYGGAFAQRLAKSDEGAGVTERLQGFGTVVMTASNSLEFAWQEDSVDDISRRLSVFTSVLVDGLKDGSADTDRDGQITVKELYDYANKQIRLLRVRQTPTLSSVGQEGNLVIARARPGRQAQIASPAIDLSSNVTIREGGNEGASVGLALAVAMEASLRYNGRTERLSARYGYARARILDGDDEWEADRGVTLASGVRAAKEFGLPLESAWPYIAGQPSLPDGQTWDSLDAVLPRFRARFRPISVYEEIPYHLLRGQPILTGLSVFEDGWYNDRAMSTGWIKVSRHQQLLGGHAVVIVGYDSANDALKFANSWGESWGASGFGYIPRRALEQSLEFRSKDAPRIWAVEVPLDRKHCLVGDVGS